MSVHDIPPVTDHPSTCECFVCYCLRRQQARVEAAGRALPRVRVRPRR